MAQKQPTEKQMAQETDFGTVKWHNLTVEECMGLQNTQATGLSETEAQRRADKYGTNELTPPPKPGFLMKLFMQVNNILIYILVGAAILSGILQEWKEVGLICGVVIINVSIGLIQEGKAEKAADAIKNMLAPQAMVIRDGREREIPAKEIVPGDIVKLKAGDQVPADLRLFDIYRLQTFEAMLTGESNPIPKHQDPVEVESGLGDRKCMAFSATQTMDGEAKGIVIGTGDFAEIGRISAMVAKEDDTKTNLMIQLEIFGRWISVFVAVIAIVTLFIAKYKAGNSWGDAFKSAVAIAVAIIPEGLPAVVTISLAIAMQKMAAKNAIIRKLPAIETLGSLSTICSDKTGTLTKNEMTVQKLQTAKAQYDITGVGYSPDGHAELNGTALPADHVKRVWAMMEGAVLNNGSGLNQDQKNGQWIPVGYPTEVSLLTLGMKMGLPGLKGIDDCKAAKPKVNGVPFASEHKFMCQVHADNGKLVCHVKGAPDRLIPKCKDQVMDDDLSKTAPIDPAFWQEQARQMASLGLRTLAICRAEWPESRRNEEMDADTVLKAQPFLTMCGIVAILDPPRPEAIEAIKVAHEAGIVVKMITGDHPETAIAIGKMLGIVDPTAASVRAYTGPELDNMTDQQLEGIVKDTNIFARASPENKISIVKALKNKGEITSMTGDGVNDAPALKAANIGVAMGITGTDVSKEAAKMVLADDNFATIVAAIGEGRRVWDNLVKILLYNMPVNLAQGLSVFFAYVIDVESVPLTAIQVLYVNMITSVTMGLMLAMEPPEADIMQRPPRRKGKRLFGKLVMWNCLWVSALIVVCVISAFAWNYRDDSTDCLGDPSKNAEDCNEWYDEKQINDFNLKNSRRAKVDTEDPRINAGRAEAFNMLVFAEIAYALNCRFTKYSSIRKELITGNKWCWVAISVTVILQVFLTYTPGVREVFNNAPGPSPGGDSWARILVGALLVFIIVEIMKFVGPRFLLPIIKPCMNACIKATPEALSGPDRTDDEAAQNIHFIATSASTVGMTHPQPRRASQMHGTSQPVSPQAVPLSPEGGHVNATRDIPALSQVAGAGHPGQPVFVQPVFMQPVPMGSMLAPPMPAQPMYSKGVMHGAA